MKALRAVASEADTISFAVGFCALVTGTALLSVPAALIFGGLILTTLPFLASRRP